jgi:membrane protease YdiL (CAAX protease family)
MSKDSSSNPSLTQPRKSWRFTKVLLLVFGTIGIFFVGQIIGIYLLIALLSVFGKNSTQIESLLSDNSVMQFVTIFLIEIITLGLLWWLHKFRKQPFLKSVGLDSRPGLRHLGYAAFTYFVYFITLLATVAVATKFIPSIDVNQQQQLGFEAAQGGELVFVFLTLVVLPPIAEEILFRGFLFKRLHNQVGVYIAAFITSVIFALAHTEFLGDNPLNWIAAIDTFVLSFFLIVLLVKTKSLWSSIFLHGIKNLIAFVFLFLL